MTDFNVMREGWRCAVAGLFVAVAAAITLVGSPAEAADKGSRWGAEYFPNVPLVTQDGEVVHFYDDLIKDKVVAINFMFTSCNDVCPAETARLRQLQGELGDRVGHDVFMYSISIDPETDTPEALKHYSEKFKVGPGWLFLTGKAEDIDLLQKKLGLFLADLPDPDDHNVNLIVGNEATGRWMKRSPYDDPKVLAEVIGSWLHNWKVPNKGIAGNYEKAPAFPRLSRGEYLFRTRCVSCHALGSDGPLGPDLLGVTEKRDPVWLARWLKEPDQMLAEKDSIAVELFARYNEIPMPNLSLNDVDVAALMDYLASASRDADSENTSAVHMVPTAKTAVGSLHENHRRHKKTQ